MEILYKFLSEILIASGGLAVLSKLFLNWLQKRRCRKFTDGIVDVSHVYDIMQETRVKLGNQRILILKSTNGGGVPKLDSPVYSTILHEVYAPEVSPIKDSWQKRPTDSFYCQLLCKVIQKKRTFICKKEIEGELKNLYELHGHGYSCIVALKSLPDKFLYMSFIFEERITNKQQAIITDTVYKIKNQFDKNLGGFNDFK